jgi:hypothetical protein
MRDTRTERENGRHFCRPFFISSGPPESQVRICYCVALRRRPMAVTLQRNVGMLLLGLWLVLYGLAGLVALGLPSPLMAVLALLAGILILVGR